MRPLRMFSVPGSLGEQRQLRLPQAAEDIEIHLDAGDAARGGEGDCLRLELLRREDPPARRLRRVDPDALQVAGELLDGLDRPDPLDLDRNPTVLAVAA